MSWVSDQTPPDTGLRSFSFHQARGSNPQPFPHTNLHCNVRFRESRGCMLARRCRRRRARHQVSVWEVRAQSPVSPLPRVLVFQPSKTLANNTEMYISSSLHLHLSADQLSQTESFVFEDRRSAHRYTQQAIAPASSLAVRYELPRSWL